MYPSHLPTVTVHDVQGEVLLDVREDHEWAEVRAPGAVHIPMSQLQARVGEIPDVRPLNVICHLGGRSAQVTAWLIDQGVDARNVEGGMDEWQRAGLPVEP